MGFVVAGTTGEASTLTDEEQLALIELAASERPAGTTVVAGTGTNDTRHAIFLTERATAAGADAHLSVTPYYNKPSRLGLKRHYEAIAQATDKPILLYNIPGRTRDEHARRLAGRARRDRQRGRRQAGQCAGTSAIDGLKIYAGDDASFARTLDMGGAGGVLVGPAMSSATRCAGWSTSPTGATRSTSR